ncbi:hypothetical protein COCMIDRAFT_88131 [Bipolaris oryzae ATCC 44560]|uniref:Uncharacterized protein n=1 Tax=Bipolaris oryzae ATCC 44560 TaxID=930090 RepID=W6ZDW1_COCMI|nr:uncharacterized protein COCMIDRAFT_88131 [Bipolaris oryzae ATCC 44560]EUC48165.1 hypothetical protein COCMIDRAFT_88131 [Bipolaris oryzae ATCC 44560]
MLALKLILIAATSVLGVAVPEPTAVAQQAASCTKNNEIVNALKKLGAPGANFCREYINPPTTSTVTATITPTAVITTSTAVVTVTRTQCGEQKRAALKHFQVETFDKDTHVKVDKRTNIPFQIVRFPAAKIADACRCLCTKPKSPPTPITTTVTTFAPVPCYYNRNCLRRESAACVCCGRPTLRYDGPG